jgi:exonuclease III
MSICLQEIKVRPEQLSADEIHAQFGEYLACWNPAARPGYSGVVTFSRQEPLADPAWEWESARI